MVSKTLVRMVHSMVDDNSTDYIENEQSKSFEPAVKSEVRKQVEKFIGLRYDVYLVDGRIIKGTLIATDRDSNMVFNKADERWENKPYDPARYLGQAMISKKYVKKMLPIVPEKLQS